MPLHPLHSFRVTITTGKECSMHSYNRLCREQFSITFAQTPIYYVLGVGIMCDFCVDWTVCLVTLVFRTLDGTVEPGFDNIRCNEMTTESGNDLSLRLYIIACQENIQEE